MAGQGDAGIDPRFDPTFQRGYDPEVHRPRPSARPRPAEPVVEPVETPVVEVVEPSDVISTGLTADLAEPPARVIPYRLILLAASIVAVAGAALLLWARITANPTDRYYGSNAGLLFRDQLADSLMMPLLIAGSTGFILWLAIGALHRRDDA